MIRTRPLPPLAGPLPALAALVRSRAATGRVHRVSVVGNAPLRPSAARATRIDDADVVVRMTTFALDAAEPGVGRRADVVVVHRALRPGPGTFADHPGRLYLLAEPGRRFGEPAALPAWWPRDLGAVPIPDRLVTAALAPRLAGRFSAVWPSTGTLTVALIHTLFPDAAVELFGSSLLQPRARRSVLEHAWGGTVALTPEHRLGAERRLHRGWLADGWLRVAA